MARNTVVSGGMPVDQPSITRPGLKYREADMPGNAKWLSLPADSPERRKQGDLPQADGEARPLTGSGMPFKNLRSGR